MTSEDNMTRLWIEFDSYPAAAVAAAASSGYSLTDAVAICVASTLLMATIVIGNVLVIIAVFNEISLNSEQNWFVASLAVADLTIGVLVMPFSLAQESGSTDKLRVGLNFPPCYGLKGETWRSSKNHSTEIGSTSWVAIQ